MPSDPWLTDDGELHPAAEWMGLPEWKGNDGLVYRLTPVLLGYGWRVEWNEPDKGKGWNDDHDVTVHEAAALLEKHLREKLAERFLDREFQIVHDEPDKEWRVQTRGSGGWVVWGRGTTYAAALQDACMAAKGEDDGKG